MTPELRRRSALALFIAMALATACGLPHLPSVDPLSSLTESSWVGAVCAALLYACLAWFFASRALQQVWRGRHASLALWLSVVLVTAALSVWALTVLKGETGDARLLCWLITLPLWSCLSGLTRSGALCHSLRRMDGGEDFVEHLGAAYHVHMRRSSDQYRPRTWQYSSHRGEDDVVTVAEAAYKATRS